MTDGASSHRRRLAAIVFLLLLVGAAAVWLVRGADDPASGAPSQGPAIDPAAPSVLAGSGRTNAGDLTGDANGADRLAGTPTSPTPFRIVGRVFDGRYQPAAGVAVTVEDGRGPGTSGLSDAEGRFSIALPSRPGTATEYGLRARAADGRCAATFVRGFPGRPVAEAGGLILLPAHTLTVRATADGRPVANAEVSVSTLVPYAPPSFVSGSGAPFVGWSHAARTDASGEARIDAVPLGDVRVLVRGPGPVRGEVRVSRSDVAAPPILVRCEPARDVEVLVVRAETGLPIAGAHLRPYDEDGWPLSDPGTTPDTDAQGRAVLRSVPLRPAFSVTVVHDGVRWPFGYSKATAVAPSATTLRIEMPRGDTLRFPLEPGDGPVPVAETAVSVQTVADDEWLAAGDVRRDGLVRDGAVEVVRVRGESVRAVLSLPDGRVAEAHTARDAGTGLVTPQPVRFRSPRTLRVRVTDIDGAVATGCEVRLFLENGARASVSTPIDATGRATFPGLLPKAYGVRVETCPELVEPFRRGVFVRGESVDLSEGDRSLDVVVARREEAVVRVRTAGATGLPSDAVARVGLGSETLDPRVPDGLVVDVATGEIRFTVRPPDVLVPYLDLRTRDQGGVRLPLTRGEDGRLGGVIDLAPTGRILLRAHVPPDRDRTWAGGVLPERLEPDGKFAWPWQSPPMDDRPDLLYLGVPPGRYRARDRITGRVSDPVDVVAGAEPTVLFLDVSRAQVVEGTIELPDGLAPERARVLVLGDGIDPEDEHPPITVIAPDRFRVTIPGDRPVRLVPAAEGCVPDPSLPEIVLESPMPGLRLRLVRATPR